MTYDQWLLVFRMSGAVFLLSLLGLLVQGGGPETWMLWVIASLSGTVCACAALKLRDEKREDAVEEGHALLDMLKPMAHDAVDED